MAPLSSDRIEQLATSIKNDLSKTSYACSSLCRIPGGSASFTFRGTLESAIVLPDGRDIMTVIVKKATDFAAINSDFALDSGRSKYEELMLKALANFGCISDSQTIPIHTPQVFYYDMSEQIQIIEDLQPAKDLAQSLTSPDVATPSPNFEAIGLALGNWLREFHVWGQAPAQLVLQQQMHDNQSSRELKWRTTYDTIIDITEGFHSIRREDRATLRRVSDKASRENRGGLELSSSPTQGDSIGLIHADFWAGNVLFDASPSPKLYIIDFEFAHIGHRAMDLGQMIGDLLEKSHMCDSDSSTRTNCEAVLQAFVNAYGVINEEMAFRVVIHAGVHVINWCARHPGVGMKGKVERLIHRAVAIIVKAWEEDRDSFDGDILSCLFRRI